MQLQTIGSLHQTSHHCCWLPNACFICMVNKTPVSSPDDLHKSHSNGRIMQLQTMRSLHQSLHRCDRLPSARQQKQAQSRVLRLSSHGLENRGWQRLKAPGGLPLLYATKYCKYADLLWPAFGWLLAGRGKTTASRESEGAVAPCLDSTEGFFHPDAESLCMPP